jgi:PqqD family protein of HPr-rel-A system
LQINRLKDGCVVYQPEQDRVHFLNQTAAMVLELCDGHHDDQDIEAQVAEHLGLHAPDRKVSGGILQRFLAEGLIMVKAEPADVAAGVRKRPVEKY